MSERGTRRLELRATTVAARVAEAGMTAMEAQAAEEGAEIEDAMIFVGVEGQPEGEDGQMVHPRLKADRMPGPSEVLAYAVSCVSGLARAIGVPIDIKIGGQPVRRPAPKRNRNRSQRRR